MLSDGVAFNSALVAADPAQWCGREVKIYNADGSEFTYSGGSLYIWDGCDACSSSDSGILDLSGMVSLKLLTYHSTNMWQPPPSWRLRGVLVPVTTPQA